ncbi:DUF1120 domain-containing protein [Erwinia sp. LJJL01]|uniref:DUF1120 domain-containing protein n=1 Tax=Erwinia sp. LJJL01 TaxID=3391839 RepID=UPI001061FBDF
MKKITVLAASILCVIASGQAMASSSANLQVTGKLVPSACDVTVGGGGQGIVFGDIDVAKLNKDKPTELKDIAKKIAITVTCPEAAFTGIKFSDMATANKDSTAFSLGYKNDAELGTFKLVFDPKESNIDGKPADAMYWRDKNGHFMGGGGASETTMPNSTVLTTAGFDISSSQGSRTLAKVKRFGLSVIPTINALSSIGSVQEAELTGIATVDIIYL